MDDGTKALLTVIFAILLSPLILAVGAVWLVVHFIQKDSRRRDREDEATRVRSAAAAAERESRALRPDDRSIWLPADGREIFTSYELLLGRVYAVTIVGKCFYTTYTSGAADWTPADPLYCVDTHNNFTCAHDGFRLDGKPVPRSEYHLFREERAAHRYRFRIDGTDTRLAVTLQCPNARSSRGGVFVRIEVLPEGTPSPVAEAREAARRIDDEAYRTQLQRKVAALLLLAEPLANWSDPEFRSAFAKRHGNALLNDRGEISAEHVTLHAKDPEVIEVMRREHPDAYAALTGRLAAYLIAEREALKPRRRKPSTAEVQAQIGRREATVAEDERVAIEAAITGYEKRAATLRAKSIDEDEIENLLGTLQDVVAGARQRLEARKGGGNAAFTTLG